MAEKKQNEAAENEEILETASEEVVDAAMAVCKKLEERYNYNFDNDLCW